MYCFLIQSIFFPTYYNPGLIIIDFFLEFTDRLKNIFFGNCRSEMTHFGADLMSKRFSETLDFNPIAIRVDQKKMIDLVLSIKFRRRYGLGSPFFKLLLPRINFIADQCQDDLAPWLNRLDVFTKSKKCALVYAEYQAIPLIPNQW
jgi:hypothetical protein